MSRAQFIGMLAACCCLKKTKVDEAKYWESLIWVYDWKENCVFAINPQQQLKPCQILVKDL